MYRPWAPWAWRPLLPSQGRTISDVIVEISPWEGPWDRRKCGLEAICLSWRLFQPEDRDSGRIFLPPGSPEKNISATGEFPRNQLTNWGELEVL
jgi:hypothetical protein